MEFAHTVLQFVASGGSAAIITLLFVAIVVLVWDRKTLNTDLSNSIQKVYDAKDSETKSIKEIVDKYHKGNLDLVQALNEIRVVLVTIQNTTRK